MAAVSCLILVFHEVAAFVHSIAAPGRSGLAVWQGPLYQGDHPQGEGRWLTFLQRGAETIDWGASVDEVEPHTAIRAGIVSIGIP